VRRRLALASLALSFSSAAFSQTDKLPAIFQSDGLKQVESSIDPVKSHNPDALYYLSKIKEALHKTDEAVDLAETAVRLDHNQAKYHLQLAQVLSDKINHVSILKKISLAARIHSEFETAVKLEPENTKCLLGLMMFYQSAPSMVGGNKEKAQRIARQISAIDESMGYLAQAKLASAGNHKNEVEDLYWSAFKANPGNVDTVLALASYYASSAQKRYDSAENYAEQALRDLDQTINRVNSRAASR